MPAVKWTTQIPQSLSLEHRAWNSVAASIESMGTTWWPNTWSRTKRVSSSRTTVGSDHHRTGVDRGHLGNNRRYLASTRDMQTPVEAARKITQTGSPTKTPHVNNGTKTRCGVHRVRSHRVSDLSRAQRWRANSQQTTVIAPNCFLSSQPTATAENDKFGDKDSSCTRNPPYVLGEHLPFSRGMSRSALRSTPYPTDS